MTSAAPETPPPTYLLDLPTELLVRVLPCCDSPVDIARVAAVSLLFHSSLAVEGIRLWARERGFDLPALPEGEGCAVRWLCYSALLCESNPPARAAAGDRHSVFIDGEGRLSSCGSVRNSVAGLLGHGEGVARLNTPTRLPSTLGGERAVSVSAGAFHSLALTADGAVWSWGYGGYGKLGHGDEQHRLLPKKIEAFAGRRVVAVSASAGGQHSTAITADGAVWSWGTNTFGKLGHGDGQDQLLPKNVEALAGQRVVAVSAGFSHSIAVTADGAVWSWGYGARGQLGHGDQQEQLLPKEIEAFTDQRVVAVSAGARHSLAITADGAVWSWGDGNFGNLGHGDAHNQLVVVYVTSLFGRLGHGDQQSQLLPKKIEAFAGRRVIAVSGGDSHSIARTADGATFAWGKGEDGCLGHGEGLSNQLLPKKIEAWAPGPMKKGIVSL